MSLVLEKEIKRMDVGGAKETIKFRARVKEQALNRCREHLDSLKKRKKKEKRRKKEEEEETKRSSVSESIFC